MPSVPVYLFKDDSDPGRYAAPLATAGYAARTVPTLQTELLSAPLVPLIAPGGSAWEAVIITSRRAAEAWVQAVEEVEASGAHSPSEEDFGGC
jgi:uroporphyrinogen-III synthase